MIKPQITINVQQLVNVMEEDNVQQQDGAIPMDGQLHDFSTPSNDYSISLHIEGQWNPNEENSLLYKE